MDERYARHVRRSNQSGFGFETLEFAANARVPGARVALNLLSPDDFRHGRVDAGPESASLFPSRLSPNAERDGFGRKPLERSRFSVPLTAHPSRKRRAACCCVTRFVGKRLVEKRWKGRSSHKIGGSFVVRILRYLPFRRS